MLLGLVDNAEAPANSTEGWGKPWACLGDSYPHHHTSTQTCMSHTNTLSHTEAAQGPASLLYLSRCCVQDNVSTGLATWYYLTRPLVGGHTHACTDTDNVHEKSGQGSFSHQALSTDQLNDLKQVP